MPRRISQVFEVPPARLRDLGVFNGFVDVDSKLYIDPFLLRSAKAPELQGAHDAYSQYFEKVLKLLRLSTSPGDRLFREAVRMLCFKEHAVVALGYSEKTTRGSGIGMGLARHLAATAKQIIDAGIEDPTIFDLLGLIEENVGADRISDMTTAIILPRLFSFASRIARDLSLPGRGVTYQNTKYSLPKDPKTGQAVLLLPSELLRSLPVAKDWSDVDVVLAHNETLRRKVNALIGETWREATRKKTKEELRRALLSTPELFRDLLDSYQNKTAKPYDFASDPDGLTKWHDAALEYCSRYPLEIEKSLASNLPEIIHRVCDRFGSLISDNGLNQLLYSGGGDLRNERFAQLLFFGVADAYCEANNLDISRESNAGRGAVDFKISSGYSNRATVEVKYSSNSRLCHGYETQLPVYDAAEKATHSTYLVLQTKDSTSNIERLQEVRNKFLASGHRAPEILVYDARLRASASKL